MSYITNEQLQAITGATQQKCALYGVFLSKYMAQYGIDTPARIAAFIANAAHETGNFERIEENLNYSADGLLKTFPKYFKTRAEAVNFARNPQKIANRVYASRMCNGNEASGDGWRYRGRGMFQITGRNNYAEASKGLEFDVLNNPDVLTTPSYAVKSACWWWKEHGLNEIADTGNFDKVCDIINLGHPTAKVGDANGYPDRFLKWNRAKEILKR